MLQKFLHQFQLCWEGQPQGISRCLRKEVATSCCNGQHLSRDRGNILWGMELVCVNWGMGTGYSLLLLILSGPGFGDIKWQTSRWLCCQHLSEFGVYASEWAWLPAHGSYVLDWEFKVKLLLPKGELEWVILNTLRFLRPCGRFLSTHHQRYVIGREALLLMGAPIHRLDLSHTTENES